MKKFFLGILTLTLVVCACFALSACGDSEADDDDVLSEEGSALE